MLSGKKLSQYSELFESIAKGNIGKITALLKSGLDINHSSTLHEGRTPLHHAAFHHRNQALKLLLQKGANPNTPDSKGYTPLHYAAKFGHIDSARTLMQYKTELETYSTELEETPLFTAVDQNQLEVARFLIEQGADVNTRTTDNFSPLSVAMYKSIYPIATLLLEHGADANDTTDEDIPLLIDACSNHHTTLVMELLKYKANPDTCLNENGDMPLHIVARAGKSDMANILIQYGATLDSTNRDGLTPLSLSISHGHVKAAETLLKKGASPSKAIQNNKYPLEMAVARNDTDMVEMLLKHFAATGKHYRFDLQSTLSVAHCNDNHDIISGLLAYDKTILNTTENAKDAILFNFARTEKFHYFSVVYCSFNDMYDYTDKAHKTAIIVFIRNLLAQQIERELILRALPPSYFATYKLELAGAFRDINYEFAIWLAEQPIKKSKSHSQKKRSVIEGEIAVQQMLNDRLMHAARHGNSGMAHSAIMMKADIEYSDIRHDNRDTPLLIALKNGHNDVAELLIRLGANVNADGKHDNTPLHIAAATGNLRLVHLLLEKGAAVNTENCVFESPLYLAARNGHLPVIKLFVGKTNVNINRNYYETEKSLTTESLAGSAACAQKVKDFIEKNPSENGYHFTPAEVAKVMGEDLCATFLESITAWDKDNKKMHGNPSVKQLSLFSPPSKSLPSISASNNTHSLRSALEN